MAVVGLSVLRRTRGKRNLHPLWRECKLVQPLGESVWKCLHKLKLELPYDPTVPLLGIHSEDSTAHHRDTCCLTDSHEEMKPV